MKLKKYSSLLLFFPLFTALVVSTPSAHCEEAEDISSTVVKANDAYNEGQYEQAGALYRQAIASGATNGHLYYNLGNVEYRLKRVGHAIAAYRKALSELPRDPDVLANLRLARQESKDRLEESSSLGSLIGRRGLLFFASHLSRYELELIGLVVFVLFWTGVLVQTFRPKPALRILNSLLLVFALYFGFLVFAVRPDADGSPRIALLGESRLMHPAVVVAEEASVYSGNSETFQIVFILHDGAEIMTRERRDSWVEVLLPDNRRGWVRKEVLEIL